MRYRRRAKGGYFPVVFRRFPFFAGGFASLLAVVTVQAQDDYLKQLEAEAEKIAPTQGDSGGGTASGGSPATAQSGAGAVSESAFESLLETQYRGTYAIFKQLPVSTREEIYNRFVKGADMATVRELIVERYLSR